MLGSHASLYNNRWSNNKKATCMRKWLAQLRQRNVFKVGTAYLVAGWVLIQLGSELFGSFDAPGWVPKVFTVIIFLGFPVACLFAWALEVTP